MFCAFERYSSGPVGALLVEVQANSWVPTAGFPSIPARLLQIWQQLSGRSRDESVDAWENSSLPVFLNPSLSSMSGWLLPNDSYYEKLPLIWTPVLVCLLKCSQKKPKMRGLSVSWIMFFSLFFIIVSWGLYDTSKSDPDSRPTVMFSEASQKTTGFIVCIQFCCDSIWCFSLGSAI